MKEDTILPIIFAVVVSIGVAFFTYFLLINHVVNVEPELARENNLLNFYDQYHEVKILIGGML